MTANLHASRPDDGLANLSDPADDFSTVVAVAWPTGRPIHRYTVEEIAEGVDLYTRAIKARTAATTHPGDVDAPQR